MDNIKKILNHYGFENQREILVEECAELIQAVSKLKRKNERVSYNFLEELADVSIMIEQMLSALTKDELMTFEQYRHDKIKRQIRWINNES